MPGRTQITLLACLCAAVLAGCGSGDDGTIPPQQAQDMLALLDGVESNAQNGLCEVAQNQADDFKSVVSTLPAEVDPEVEQGLTEVAANLVTLTQEPSQCTNQGTTGETGFDTTTPTTTSAPTTSTTTSTESTTTTETSTDEQTTPTDGGGGGEGQVTIEPPAGGEGGGTGGGPPSGGIGGERSAGGR